MGCVKREGGGGMGGELRNSLRPPSGMTTRKSINTGQRERGTSVIIITIIIIMIIIIMIIIIMIIMKMKIIMIVIIMIVIIMIVIIMIVIITIIRTKMIKIMTSLTK